jgi:hypothetical protein
MEKLVKLAPWLNRFALFAVTVIFAFVGLRFSVDPADAARATGITLGSALAATTMRVTSGALPLGFSIVTLYCLTSRRRLLIGSTFVSAIVGVAVIIRALSMAVDGVTAEGLRPIFPEIAVLLISITGQLLELRVRPETGTTDGEAVRPGHPTVVPTGSVAK